MSKQAVVLADERLSPAFSPKIVHEHRQFKTSSLRQIRNSRFSVLLSVPFIYTCVIPFLLLDLTVTIYQSICFPIYRIPKVRRQDYMIFDRGRLAYLNSIQKVGCVYCSYANGLLAYIVEIAGRTEQYFCPVRHALPIAQPHSRYEHFLPYGDARAYHAKAEEIAQAYDDLRNTAK